MSDHIDILRIIARDGGRLSSADRSQIAEAANEFERSQNELAKVHVALIEANAHRAALAELVREQKPKPSFRMSTGWVQVGIRECP